MPFCRSRLARPSLHAGARGSSSSPRRSPAAAAPRPRRRCGPHWRPGRIAAGCAPGGAVGDKANVGSIGTGAWTRIRNRPPASPDRTGMGPEVVGK